MEESVLLLPPAPLMTTAMLLTVSFSGRQGLQASSPFLGLPILPHQPQLIPAASKPVPAKAIFLVSSDVSSLLRKF